MNAYPVAFRVALLAAVDGGMSKAEVARVFGVGLSTVKRYVAQRRTSGTLAPRPHPGRPPLIPREHQATLLALVATAPGASCEVYRRQWEELTGTAVSPSTMARTLHRWGLRRGRVAPGAQP